MWDKENSCMELKGQSQGNKAERLQRPESIAVDGVLKIIDLKEKKDRERRIILGIVSDLLQRLYLDENNRELVSLIGKIEHVSNQQALVIWVSEKFRKLSLDDPYDELIEGLLSQLICILMDKGVYQ